MNPVPKPTKRQRKPRQPCSGCGREYTARALVRHAPKCGRGNKYGARQTVVDGIAFPSMLHAAVYRDRLSPDPEIVGIKFECRVEPPRCFHCGVRPAKPVKVDFRVALKNGRAAYHEAKGKELERWKEFVAWWRKDGPAPLHVWKGTWKRPLLAEVIYPANGKWENA